MHCPPRSSLRSTVSGVGVLLGRFGAVALGVLLSGCFIETKAATVFRHDCKDAGDCDEGEVCGGGLCQFACTGATTDNPGGSCPADGEYAGCVNGYCANICDVTREDCPGSQSCVALPGGESSMGGGSAAVCTVPCQDGVNPCAVGEACFSGFCVPQSSAQSNAVEVAQ